MKRKRAKPTASLQIRLKGSACHEVNDLAAATAGTHDQAASVLISIGADAINGGRNRVAYLEFVADAKRAAALKRQADEASNEAAALTRNARKLLERRTGEDGSDALEGLKQFDGVLREELATPAQPRRPRKRKPAADATPATEAQ